MKGLLMLSGLSTVCLVLQLLPLISVPITGYAINYNLALSTYENNSFGVFGLCNINLHQCSHPHIGYPANNSVFYATSSTMESDALGSVELPSQTAYTVSKLLVVHVIGFGLSCFLCIASYVLIGLKVFDQRETYRFLGPLTQKKRDISGYIDIMLMLALMTFLLCLLAFLVDILLFAPYLLFVAWLQTIPIVILPVECSALCLTKRSIITRKYMEGGDFNVSNDMRIRKNISTDWNDDSASDDGFYVHTDGFYSNYGHNDAISHTEDWVRHTPHQNELNEDEQNDGNEQNDHNDDIELRSLRSSRAIRFSDQDRRLC